MTQNTSKTQQTILNNPFFVLIYPFFKLDTRNESSFYVDSYDAINIAFNNNYSFI